MRGARRAAYIVLTASFTLTLSSCSSCSRILTRSGSEGGAAGHAASAGVPATFYTPPGAVYDVTYTLNTVRIDLPTAQKTLRSVSADGQVFLFDASDSRIRELTQGKVMFLEHLGVRRVVGAVPQGSQIAVVTEGASLTDFIQDGRIEFTVPINFRRTRAQALPLPGEADELGNLRAWLGPPPVVFASEEENKASIGLHTKGEINNWEFELEGEPEGDGFSLSLDAEKKLAGLSASVKSKGKLSHIATTFKAVIHGSKMQDFEYTTPLEGQLHVTWAALTSGENSGIGEARLKLPPFAKDVFDVYGLPLLFKVDEALIFKPGFGGKKDAGEGGFNLTYNGKEGLSIHGDQNKPEGSMEAEPTLEKTTTESLAAHGIVLAVDAPKVSVSLGTESIKEAIQEAIPGAILDKAAEALEATGLGGLVKKAREDFFKIEGAAYVQLVTEFDYAGSGPLSLVPCSMTHLNFYAQAGADAQLLAIKGESPHYNIKETKLTFREPDIPACGPK